jgi:hypothetical protein
MGNPLTVFVINSGNDSEFDIARYNDSRTLLGYSADNEGATAPKLTIAFRVP